MPAIQFAQNAVSPAQAQEAISAPPANNLMQYATAGLRGNDDSAAAFAAAQDKKQKNNTEAYKAMLADPQNAGMIAKGYGIDMTPELQGMLQQPQLMKNVIDATEFSEKMGIKNPEAAKKIMMEAAKQAQAGKAFNPVEVLGAADGMDLGEPMTEYQAQDIAIKRQREAKRPVGGAAPKQPKAPPMLEDPRVPIELRIRGKALLAGVQRGTVDPNGPELKEFSDQMTKVMGGTPAEVGYGTPAPAAAPASPAPAAPTMRPVPPPPQAGEAGKKFW